MIYSSLSFYILRSSPNANILWNGHYISAYPPYHLTLPTSTTACWVAEDVNCKDTSPMCSKARTMGLCKLHRFKQQCCSTCTSPHP